MTPVMENVIDTLSRRKSRRESGGNWKQKIRDKRKSLMSSSSSAEQSPPIEPVREPSSPPTDSPPCPLANLPPELLLHIFSFLNYASLFPLKIAGSRYLTEVASSTPRPTPANYMLQVQDIASGQKNNRSALHVAVLWQQEKLVEGLLSRHSRATSQDDLGNTPLHDAAVLGLNNVADILINSRRYTIFVRNGAGQIPLHLAVRNGNAALIQLMMKYGNGDQMVRITDSVKRTPLHFASEAGQDHIVSLLLKGRPSRVLDKDIDGNSPLHLAAANGHLETLKLLLRKKAVTLSERNKAGKTCLHMACGNGHEVMVYFLVRKSTFDISTRDYQGNTPLHEVARNGNDELIKLLLRLEMNPSLLDVPTKAETLNLLIEKNSSSFTETLRHFRDKRKASPLSNSNDASTKLHFAASIGSERAVRELLEGGANVNAVDVNGFTPLHRAALSGSTSVVQYLLDNGARLATCDIMKRTALHLAVGVEAVEVARLLLSKGIDINAKDAAGNTALHIAATIPNEDTLRLLTEQVGIFINCTNEQKDAPLHKGSKAGNVAAAKLLLEKNADVTAQNKSGASALMFAIEYGHAEVVDVLIEKSSHIMQKRADGKRALDIATAKWKSNFSEENAPPLKRPFEGILRRLLEKLAGCAPSYKPLDSADVYFEQPILHLAAQLGELDIVRIAWERRNAFDPSSLNKKGEPPIYLAAVHGHEEVVRFLSGKGLLDLRLSVKLAAKSGNENAIRLLLREEPDYPKLTGNFGEALCLAAASEHEGMVKLLLQKGADPKGRDDVLGYPIISAAQGGHVGIIELLLSRGATVDTRDIQDLPNNEVRENTPLLAAVKAGKLDAVQWLLARGAQFDDLVRLAAYPVLLDAASSGNKAMVEFLLQHGIGEKAPTYDRDGVLQPGGPTVLAAAAKGGHTDIMAFLLKQPNVNVNSPCKYSRPALTEAIVGGHKECIKLLIDGGADVNAVYLGPNTFPETALIVAASKDNAELVGVLLDAGADPNNISGLSHPSMVTTVSTPLMPARSIPKYRARYTPLAEAAASGNAAVVKMLLEKGADVNLSSGRRGTPLKAAADRGHEEVCKVLLEHGAHLSHPDSPLVGAATEGHAGIVSLLLDARRKMPFEQDYDEGRDFRYALRAAAEKGRKNVVVLMLNAENAKHRHEMLCHALVNALRHHHDALANTVLDIGGFYFLRGERLDQALRLAVVNKARDVADRLVKLGAVEGPSGPIKRPPPPPLYIQFQDESGGSHRIMSSPGSSRDVGAEVKALVAPSETETPGAEVSAPSGDDEVYERYTSLISGTPIAFASAHSRIARFLLENIASIHEQDNMGRTPLMVALEGVKNVAVQGSRSASSLNGAKNGTAGWIDTSCIPKAQVTQLYDAEGMGERGPTRESPPSY